MLQIAVADAVTLVYNHTRGERTMLFPCCTFSAQSPLSKEVAAQRILEFGSRPSDDFKVTAMRRDADGAIRFHARNKNALNRNSFMPNVCVTISERSVNTQITMRFELAKCVKIFLAVWSLLVLAAEIGILILKALEQLADNGLVWLPAAMLAAAFSASYIGLRFSAKRVFQAITADII